jgi:hypothetical protein
MEFQKNEIFQYLEEKKNALRLAFSPPTWQTNVLGIHLADLKIVSWISVG